MTEKTPASKPLPKIPPAAINWIKKAGAGSRQFAGALTQRRAIDSVVIGCLLTLLVIAIDSAGGFYKLEFAIYDARAQAFQYFLPKPSDKLLHLDIDEGALQAVAASDKTSWPWPRSILAEIMDEMALAQPKVVGLDVMFPEQQGAAWIPAAAAPTTRPGGTVRGDYRLIDHDAAFGASLAKLGCTLVPVSLPYQRPVQLTGLQIALRAELARDLNTVAPKLAERLQAMPEFKNIPDLTDQVLRDYLAAWQDEMFLAIDRELEQHSIDRDALKKKLIRQERTDLLLTTSFDELYDEAISKRYVMRFARPIPPGMPALFPSRLEHLPVSPIAAAAKYGANVEYPQFRDGVVRAVPLFVKVDDQMYPQMGLAMACAQLNIDIGSIRVAGDKLIVPKPDGGEIIVPFRSYKSIELGEQISTFIDIPWWGTDNWSTMYDSPKHEKPVNHLSIVGLWDVVLTKRKIQTNAAAADDAIIAVLSVIDESAAEAYAAKRPAPDDVESRQVVFAAHQADAKAMMELVQSAKPDELDDRTKRFITSYESLSKLMGEFASLQQRLTESRAEMRQKIGGKAVFVGWTATGVAADFVPTSLHAKCPGVMLHGAIFNGMMTGELWRTLPDWVTFVVTAFLGLCMTAGAAFLTPARAFGVAVCLIVGYIFVNGLLLFDYSNIILGAAGPLVCIVGVSQGCTLVRLIIERYQRSRIEGRFRSYVDPALVDYVIQHPDQIKLEGQVREMTVCFTDLENFTPLTAQLKEATVPLLNRIFDAMVPEIRGNNGYVNKFLGDGIMFFFGAPAETRSHAQDAIRSVLQVHAAVKKINEELKEELKDQGLTDIKINVRAGVNTGNMVVGDAGSEKASDYTVLGDDVNLAARMESANKQLGTTMLVAARTVELAGDDSVALLRPVGQICVVGRTEPVTAFEIVCRRKDATDEQRRLVEVTTMMIDAYREAQLKDCLTAADVLDREFGPSKLTKLYRERCEFFLAEPSMQDFTCSITLTEK